MANNTGRGSRVATLSGRGPAMPREWIDTSSTPLVVWTEPEGVAIYEGEKERATHRRLLTPEEARELGLLLLRAARESG